MRRCVSVLPRSSFALGRHHHHHQELPPRGGLMREMVDVAHRSAYAREKLRERIREPSVETALRHLRDFATSRPFSQHQMSELAALDDVGRLERLLDAFERWFFVNRAPRVVSMSDPWNWFPRARQRRRRVVFHCGPTNSGKTHDALLRLRAAKSGVYCAPLKALAAQVWRHLDEHVPCDLLIGDERRFGGSAEHVACTVEMTPVDFAVDVGVIDEIQLIGDRDRGWAWTRALLGLPAAELHLCGEERALPVVQSLLKKTAEDRNLTVIRHERLVPLSLAPSLNRDYRNIQNGDCVVSFSRRAIFNIKRQIERAVPTAEVNVVYGALPFAVREEQARRFNDGVECHHGTAKRHVLVTTDAIAYGLNMNIRRIVFETLMKFDGRQRSQLPATTLMQVGGRAGRFGRVFGDMGYVTSFHPGDLQRIEAAFARGLPPIVQAGLIPTSDVLEVYARMHPQLRFVDLVECFVAEIVATALFFTCDMSRSILAVARALDGTDPLELRDRILFCYVPLSDSSERGLSVLRQWAAHHGRGESVPLLLQDEFDGVAAAVGGDVDQRLQRVEWVYRMCEAYCWLSWRFRRTFSAQEQSEALKAASAALLDRLLQQVPREACDGPAATMNGATDGAVPAGGLRLLLPGRKHSQ